MSGHEDLDGEEVMDKTMEGRRRRGEEEMGEMEGKEEMEVKEMREEVQIEKMDEEVRRTGDS